MRLRISSLPIILVMVRRIYVFNRLLIIKTKVSIVVHYLGLGHEAMTRTVCLYVNNLAMIGSDNGLLPGRCQAIIWTSTEILLI